MWGSRVTLVVVADAGLRQALEAEIQVWGGVGVGVKGDSGGGG